MRGTVCFFADSAAAEDAADDEYDGDEEDDGSNFVMLVELRIRCGVGTYQQYQ